MAIGIRFWTPSDAGLGPVSNCIVTCLSGVMDRSTVYIPVRISPVLKMLLRDLLLQIFRHLNVPDQVGEGLILREISLEQGC